MDCHVGEFKLVSYDRVGTKLVKNVFVHIKFILAAMEKYLQLRLVKRTLCTFF